MRKEIQLTIFLFTVIVNFINAQEVQISNFSVIQYNKKALINWTIESGSTCNGITIYHSTDSINFEQIGYIGGVCGNLSEPLKYDFTHSTPTLNVENFYRLKFGTQLSSIYSIHLTYVEPNQVLLAPNPCENLLKISVNKDQNFIYKLIVFDASGIPILTKNEMFGDEFEIDVS